MRDHQIKCPECGSGDYYFDNDGLNCICRKCNHEFKGKIKPLRIFLSYGRDDHAAVAWKLKEDLEEKGHKVWFDNERLKTGVAWENYIEKGLDWVSKDLEIGRLVLVMTPHSIRRQNPDIPDSDDGYCLNEIHRALQKRVDVIPVMLVWCEPPLSICRVQWLDMMDCLPTEENESTYKKKFDQLLEALEEGEVKDDFQTSIKTILNPLEFDVEILKHIERFTGREWVLKSIDEWIKNLNASRIFWIVGDAGTGKTAIASWLCEKRRKAAAFHLCQHNDTIKSDPRRCLMSLAYQLSTQIPDYNEQLKSLKLKKLAREMNVSTLFKEIIAKPLSKIPEPDETPLIILIDALDEATKDGKNELANFISDYFYRNPEETPQWLRVIITSRGVSDVKVPLQGINPHILDAELPENLKDIQEYLERELEPYYSGGQVDPYVVNKLLEKSEGNFLYVEWIRRELENGNISIENVNKFPQGLGSIYFDFFSRNFPDIDYYEEKIAPALDIISAAQEPLELDFIASIMNWNDREKRKFQRKTDSLFITKDDKIKPFHKSLMDWLKNSGKAGDYYVSEEDGHKKLAQIGWDIYKNDFNHLPSYMLSHIPKHLIRSSRWDEIQEILTDLNYIEVKCAVGMTYRLIEDYNLTLNVLPEAQVEILKKIEDEKRLKKYSQDLVSYAKGEIEKLEIIHSIEPWGLERIKKDTERIINNPTRLDRIKAFSQFVNSQSHAFVEFGHLTGFCLQQAYNSADASPVAESAKEIINENLQNPIILRGENWRPKYNPHQALLKTLEGHNDYVNAVSVSIDTRTVITGSNDKTLRVWDLETGEIVKIIEGHKKSIMDVDITSDGKTAITGSDDRTARVWNLDTGKQVKILDGHQSSVLAVAVSSDGRTAITGCYDGSARVWNLDTGKQVKILDGHQSSVLAVAVSSDGRTAITGSGDSTARVWDLADKHFKILNGHKSIVRAVAVSSDGRTAITGSYDNNLIVWDLKTGKRLKSLVHTNFVEAVAVSSDGKIGITGSGDKFIRVWNLDSGKLLKTLKTHTNYVKAVAVSSDGKIGITGSGDKTIRVWNLEISEQIKTLGHTKVVSAAAFSSDGKTAITGGGDKLVRVWDLSLGEQVKTLGHATVVRAVAVCPDARTVITGSGDKLIRVWDLETGELVKILEGHTDYVNVVAVSSDGRIAITGSWDRTIRVWDIEAGKQVKTLDYKGVVRAVAVCPDCKTVITGSKDMKVRVWDLETGELVKILEGHTDYVNVVAVSSDGRTVITGSKDRTVRGWDFSTGKLIFVSKEESNIICLAVNDSNFLFGTSTGDVVFLHLVNLSDLPLVTAIRIWLHLKKGNIGCWDENITADCHWCGNRFKVTDELINMIKEVRKSYINQDGWLSDEAWEDPRLVSECPICKKKIRFNPFIVDNK